MELWSRLKKDLRLEIASGHTEPGVSSQKLTVSQLARLAGVGPDSIRHYERIGLVPKAERSSGGYRVWTAREVQYLKWGYTIFRRGFCGR